MIELLAVNVCSLILVIGISLLGKGTPEAALPKKGVCV